jgi:hypothetical protein
MSKKNQGPDPLDLLEAAQRNAVTSKARLDSTVVALQQRLNPSHLANEAWTGVRGKSNDLADGAMDQVRQRPAVFGTVAGVLTLFLLRKPLTRLVRWLFTREQDVDLVTTQITLDKDKLDLSAPVVDLKKPQGVKHGQEGQSNRNLPVHERNAEFGEQQPGR